MHSRVFAKEFAPVVRARGAAYFQSRAVKIDLVSNNEVHATVRGTDSYAVLLSARRSKLGIFCTCPYYVSEGPCKHVWATMLAAEERGGLTVPSTMTKIEDLSDRQQRRTAVDADDDGDDDWEDGEEEEEGDVDDDAIQVRRSPAAALPGRLVKAPRPDWRSLVESAGTHVTLHTAPLPTIGGLQIRYAVDVAATRKTGSLVVRITTFDRQRDGTWEPARVGRLRQSMLGRLPDDCDRQLLSLVAQTGAFNAMPSYLLSSPHYSHAVRDYADPVIPERVTIADAIAGSALQMMARSGRCSVLKDDGTAAADAIEWQDESYQLLLKVDRLPEGKTTDLSGQLRRGQESHAVESVPVLLASGFAVFGSHAAPVDHGGAFGWALLFRQHGPLKVPRRQEEELVEKLYSQPRLPPLELPESLRFAESRPVPVPALKITLEKVHARQGSTLMGTLSFLYDGMVVPAVRPGVHVLRAAERRLLVRDAEAEKAAASRLLTAGFRLQRPVYASGMFDRPDFEVSPRKLPAAVRELVAAGWKVEAQGKVYRQPGSFKFSVESGVDWFELEGTCDFQGVTASLPALLAALRKGETTVVLGDGSLGLLPEDWLARYGLLASLGRAKGDRLEFRQSQAGILDALLASAPDVEIDATFARVRDQLGSFAGVRPLSAPEGFHGELRTYQQEGLGWFDFLQRFGLGGCLADDMGLGKTVQVLAMLVGRKGKAKAPSLVVVPKSIVWNWTREASRFAPGLSVLTHVGKDRPRDPAALRRHDLIVTTYGTLRRDAALLASARFDYAILDEAQAIKNASSESAKAARLLQAEHRLALSGTPVENHLGDLWSLLDFLNPGLLGAAGALAPVQGAARPEPEALASLGRALRPFILRRTKAEVAKDLPAKHEETVMCELEPAQRRVYDELRDHYRASLLGKIEREGLGKSKIQVLEALLRLRQAACHPGLIDRDRADEPSAKLDLLADRLSEVVAGGHKALVFSQFTSFLALLRARLDKAGQIYEYLDGKTVDRQARVNRFQTDETCPLFLISLKAGGVGLNLTAADYVFILDPWWNPATEAQAVDRAHRIGQTKRVFVYRLLCSDTVEEKVAELQNKKRALADAIITGENSLIQGLTREDLERLLS